MKKIGYLIASAATLLIAQAPLSAATLLSGKTVQIDHQFPETGIADATSFYTVGSSAPAD